jgi:hypothetical protein
MADIGVGEDGEEAEDGNGEAVDVVVGVHDGLVDLFCRRV